MYCPRCKKFYSVFTVKFNTSNEPSEDKPVKVNFCPVCGCMNEDRDTTIQTNLFDKEEVYENCSVQILENTTTGEISVGWRPENE